MAVVAAKGGGVSYVVIRASAVLTTGYVAANSISLENVDQLQLWIDFTVGSSSGCRIKIEYSDDDTTFYQESYYIRSGNDFQHTLVARSLLATAKLVISLPVVAKYLKVSAQAISDGTGTLLAIKAARANL